ncbi:MAG: hypothetical protein ACK5N0_12230 [Synechococcaceae cyanobacterium]
MTVLRCCQAGLGAAALIALHASGSALAAPLSTGSDSIKILFSGGVDPATGLLKGSPALKATFADLKSGTFIMDTGSAGMVVYKGDFSPPAGASPAYSGVIQAYKSDNLLFEGDVYNTLIEIGTPGNSVTADVPILYATKQRCADESQTCTKKDSLRFMGVGFGEPPGGKTNWPISSNQRNPLFNITKINGQPASPTQAWIMGGDGITVGLTPANILGFDPAGLEALTPSADGFERGSAAVVASLTGTAPPPPTVINGKYSGTVLVDSGVKYAMMVLEPGVSRPNTIHCPDGPKDCTAAGYTITAFLGNPAAPLIYQIITGPDGSTSASPFAAAAPEFVNQLEDTAPY